MIQRPTSRLLAGLAAGLGCIALAFQSTAATAPPDGPPAEAQEEQEEALEQEDVVEAEEEHGPLHESMEALQAGMRTLRKAIGKPDKKVAAIQICRELQAACLVGFQHVPEPEEAVLEGLALLEFSADFRKRMLTVCETLVDLEVAFEREDKAASKKFYKQLGAQKKSGHDTYGGE